MKTNPWTVALALAGILTVGSVRADDRSSVMTSVTPVTLSGYVETSASWRIGTGSGPLPGRVFDGPAKQDGFNLDVISINLGKSLDDAQWSSGYNVDLLYGPNAVGFNPSFALIGVPLTTGDFSLMNTYVTLRVPVGNGLEVKLGTYDKILGYEAFHSPMDPNFSRSYGFAIGPGQNTGVLTSYRLCNMCSVSFGVANTYTGGVNERPSDGSPGFIRSSVAESQKAYMGAISVTLPENLGGAVINAGIIDGLYGMEHAGNTQDTTSYYVGCTVRTPVKGLSCGLSFDYRQDGANAFVQGNNWAWAAAGYLMFQATDSLKLNARADYGTGSDGTFGGSTVNGSADKLGSLTFTTDYSLWKSVISRAEVRWDHSLGSETPYNGNQRNAVTIAANIIFQF